MACVSESWGYLNSYKRKETFSDVKDSYFINPAFFRGFHLPSKLSSKLALPVSTPKEVKTEELAETEIIVVKKEIKSELVKVETASQERSSSVVPFKKRRFVEAFAGDNLETKACKVEEKQVLKEQSVAAKKARKHQAMSSDELDSEIKRQAEKKQQPQAKAALPEPTSETASSSRMMHSPCQDGAARAGTSDTGFWTSGKERTHDELCYEIVIKQSNQLEYSKMLQDTRFTKEQNEILQKTFMHVSRKRNHIQTNSGRFLKTHRCRYCDFSISHQCLSIDYIRGAPFGAELMNQATMAPSQTVVCNCGFAFFHAHLKRTRMVVVKSIEYRLTSSLRESEHSVDISCPKCYSNVVMTNRTGVCCDLDTWDGVTDHNRQQFYNVIQRWQHSSPLNPLSLDGFYTCSKGCCLIYHRCPATVEFPGTDLTIPR